MGSPFLSVNPSEWVAENELAFALRDKFPVSPGHTLIIPRREIDSWFDATLDERVALLALVDQVKAQLDQEASPPEGYNIGINVGPVAGQTVPHLHVHLIPRYPGDMDDPRGGVRGVIPSQQKYPSAPPLTSVVRDRSPGGDAHGYSAPSAFDDLPRFVPGGDALFVEPLRTAIADADEIDILSAFVQPSGLELLKPELEDAAQRGAQLRVLTGDYLGITSAHALLTLLELSSEHPTCSVRVYEVGPNAPSFHPKAYIFARGLRGAAYVGSSNLTGTALQQGVEWNLQLISDADRDTFDAIRNEFDRLWTSPSSQELTRAWIDAYRERAPVPAAPKPEPSVPPPEPHPIQREALEKLEASRADGHPAGLVVLATGLGKTFLSAFDFRQTKGRRGLFIAHREEILDQARAAWARVFPHLDLGKLVGRTRETEVDVLFASVQTLSRARHYRSFPRDHFDYIVIDEFHHAAADSYRRLITHFEPSFLLGLTATPDRMDGASLLELCGNNLVFRRNLIAGISRKLLVPFRYFGVADEVDFAPIPWRSGRFDPDALTKAVETRERAQSALEALERRAGDAQRVLVFCVSQTHADFMASYFSEKALAAAAVHSGPTSAPRAASLRQFEKGELRILCAVDVFNEGLDVPAIDAVLMLRPTASPVVFLQQIGRGLRPAEGKDHLTIIDFIGNHRTFLQRPQALVYLTGREATPYEAVKRVIEGRLELPEGCSVELETRAVDLLERLSRQSSDDVLTYEYGLLRDTHGRRPQAAELLGELGSFSAVRKKYSTYFDLVAEQGDLSDDEARVVEAHRAWFRDLMTTKMTKSFKMVALRAMLDCDAVPGEMSAEENARRSNAIIRRHLLLTKEMRDDSPSRATYGPDFIGAWRQMPLEIWATGAGLAERWFELEGDELRCTVNVQPADVETFVALTSELVDLRLAEHVERLRRNQPSRVEGAPSVLRVTHTGGRPILMFDRDKQPQIPLGDTEVEIDGERLQLHFRKIAVNKATRPPSDANVLPQILRGWFGPTAGHPGTQRTAQLERTERGLRLRPFGVDADALGTQATVVQLPVFEDLPVACGAFRQSDRLESAMRWLTPDTDVAIDPACHFLVRADGDSMDGGDRPIRDGDLVLCEWFDGRSADEVENHPTLLMGLDGSKPAFMAIKVPVKRDGRWVLESWNPSHSPEAIAVGLKLEPVARVLGPVEARPDLVLWGLFDRPAIAAAFGRSYSAWWRAGHRDLDVDGEPQSVLMVTLAKDQAIRRVEHYDDRFLSESEFHWESPNNVDETVKQGQNIIRHEEQGRRIHLFVRLTSKVQNDSQPFVYCGLVRYLSHEGGRPMSVRFSLRNALPGRLWETWKP
jgi:superfamily II DNA or RNA helicase/diadenosine tetraphosphate (Ap4A) HIT family hydrolase/HKD family nuclease